LAGILGFLYLWQQLKAFFVQIKVNGEMRDFTAPISVATLAETLKLNPKQVAIERNLEIVPRSRYNETLLSDGDAIEIVQFIGGG
jgi:thiamine biosynthesis protein ThiS